MTPSLEPHIRALVQKTVSGELDPRTVIDDVLHRLDQHRDNPIFISKVSPETLQERAAELASFDQGTRARLPLFGVPFAVKDNIDVAGMSTTAGCPEYAYQPEKTAFMVQRLLKAGAMLIGKCNLDQFATGLTGMRSVYGGPINPYSADHICGGSSSGSGVAVACGIVQFSLGTDTAGSGRIPAGFNNIVGYRPSSGLLSSSGVVPCARSLDTISIFGNCADDVRRVLSVGAAFDAKDAFSVQLSLRPMTVAAPVIGMLEPRDELFLGDEMARAAYESGLDRLRSLGYAMVTLDYSPFREISDMTYFGPSMAERTAVLGDFIKAHPNATYTPVVLDALTKAAGFSAVDAFTMLHRLKILERAIERDAWARVDMLCTPTAPTIHTRKTVESDPGYGSTSLGAYTNFAPFLGLPSVSVQNGFRADGLPTRIMFTGQRADDMRVLDVAQAFSE